MNLEIEYAIKLEELFLTLKQRLDEKTEEHDARLDFLQDLIEEQASCIKNLRNEG